MAETLGQELRKNSHPQTQEQEARFVTGHYRAHHQYVEINKSLNHSMVIVGFVLCCLMACVPTRAESYRETFDQGLPSWSVDFDPSQVKLTTQERSLLFRYQGEGAERLQLLSHADATNIRLEHAIPPAQIIDDLTISVWFHANRPGAILSLRVVFPHQIDPKTGSQLKRYMTIGSSATYETEQKWVDLSCQTLDQEIQQLYPLWRASIKPLELDTRQMYIDRVRIDIPMGQGPYEAVIDELRVGPIVTPSLSQEHFEKQTDQNKRVEFRLDRLTIDGRPFVPRIFPYQHEPVGLLKQAGANVVWISDLDRPELISQLYRAGIWTSSWPPSPRGPKGEVLQASQANLAPFGQETQGILFWILGAQISSDSLTELRDWCRLIRQSDRDFRRPILADVQYGAQIASRDVDILGMTRHVAHTPYSYQQYQKYLLRQYRTAQSGTFLMTWLQTETSEPISKMRQAAGKTPVVLEPAQLKLNLYAAIAAGCRGFGFWNWTPLNAETPGNRERNHLLGLLSLELDLLEPFLATGQLSRTLPVYQRNPSERPQSTLQLIQHLEKTGKAPKDEGLPHIKASVIHSERGSLIIPINYGTQSQFVPDSLAEENVSVVVQGLPESVTIWEMTPTGLRAPADVRRLGGGTEILLNRLSLATVLIATSDDNVITQVRRKIRELEQPYAEHSVALAKASLERISQVDSELTALRVNRPEAANIMQRVEWMVSLADQALETNDFDEASRLSDLACQLMRVLQKAQWEDAVRKLSHPTSTIHSVSYQSLPEFWKFQQQLNSGGQFLPNELSVGDFETPETLISSGWKPQRLSHPKVKTYDCIYSASHSGQFSLRIAAGPTTSEAVHTELNRPTITYVSPGVECQAGEILRLTGWVRVASPIVGSLEGFRIYDSIAGKSCATAWNTPTEGWQPFELFREVHEPATVELTLELNGFGDVLIDDLAIQRLPAPVIPSTPADPTPSKEEPKSRLPSLDFFDRLLK